MSAALTLPYVWATASAASSNPEHAKRAAGGGNAFYRRRTENLLQRYLQASLAVGRAPLVGPDLTLRGRATSCRRKNFEDVVIFAIDVEKCLQRLNRHDLRLVVKIAIQEYMFMEVAAQIRDGRADGSAGLWEGAGSSDGGVFEERIADSLGTKIFCQEGR